MVHSQLSEKWLYYVRWDNFLKKYNHGKLWLCVYWTGKGVDTSGYFVIDRLAPQPIFILGEFLVTCLWEARLHITLEKAEIRYFLSLKLVSM